MATSDPPASFDPAWEEVFQRQAWGKYPPEHVIRFVARNYYAAADRSAVRVLDLGSGPGAVTWYLAREGFSASAIDGSAAAIKQLEARFAAEGLRAETRVGDLVRLPWADNSFDLAIDNGAITCNSFAMARVIANEAYRVLVPGGRFLSANFSDRSWGYGSGPSDAPGEFTDLTEGPTVGKGRTLFLGRSQVGELYQRFTNVQVERVSYTVDGGKNQIELWVVTCQKPT